MDCCKLNRNSWNIFRNSQNRGGGKIARRFSNGIKKGQVALEFLAMMAFASIILLISIGAAYNIFQEKVDQNNIEVMRNFGYSLQNEIILASEVHDGYSRTFIVPNKIGNLNYNLYSTSEYLAVNFTQGELLFPLPVIASGAMHKGTVTIRKSGGDIEII